MPPAAIFASDFSTIARARLSRAEGVADQELEAHRRGKLGSAPESAFAGIELDRESGRRPVERLRARFRTSGKTVGRPVKVRMKLTGRRLELVAPRLPGVGDRGEDRREAGPSKTVFRRVVGPAVEGSAVRRQKERERPPA